LANDIAIDGQDTIVRIKKWEKAWYKIPAGVHSE